MEYFNIIIHVDISKMGKLLEMDATFFLETLSFGSPFWRNFGEALGDALRSLFISPVLPHLVRMEQQNGPHAPG